MKKVFLYTLVTLFVTSFAAVLYFNNIFGIELAHLNGKAGGKFLGKFDNQFSSYSQYYNIVEGFSEEGKVYTELDYITQGGEYVLNLPPANYLLGNIKNGPKFLRNSSCAAFPHFYKLKFDNVIWQIQEQSNWTFYLLGAFWDIRERNEDAPTIRIVGMMDRMDENITTNYCQVWFEKKKEPMIVEVTNYKYLWVKKWGNYKNGEMQPYIFSCPLPKNYSGPVPTSVSMVSSSPCTHATNNLRVYFDRPETKDKFAVCVKGMDFITPDWSTRLVEWIELLHIMGVTKIYIYDLAVNPNIRKVYKYYSDLDMIQVLPLTTPGGLPNEDHLRHAFLKRKMTNKRQQELIPYNDCLYRTMYRYDYISLLDIDEIIIPHNQANNWIELADILESRSNYAKSPKDSYFVFANIMYSPDNTSEREDIPEHMYMLSHPYRSSKDAGRGSGVKCFHRPEFVFSLHNHFPTGCLGTCTRIYVDHADGYLHHYRTKSAGGIHRKKNETITLVVDEHLWEWKDELIFRSNKALVDLGFIS